MTSRRAVFLDRDGVLIRTYVRDGVPHPPRDLSEMEVLPGVSEAVDRLGALGLLRIVVTNQPDVARGAQTRDAVEAMNQVLVERLSLDDVYTCYHDTPDCCTCRKPLPGLLLQAAQRHEVDLAGSFMVGDRWSDVQAGLAAGCGTFLIRESYSQGERCQADFEVPDLAAAADLISRLLCPDSTR
jgi:D-glycero-D-manno-heptose 1,7-bisphosphate phosphatase